MKVPTLSSPAVRTVASLALLVFCFFTLVNDSPMPSPPFLSLVLYSPNEGDQVWESFPLDGVVDYYPGEGEHKESDIDGSKLLLDVEVYLSSPALGVASVPVWRQTFTPFPDTRTNRWLWHIDLTTADIQVETGPGPQNFVVSLAARHSSSGLSSWVANCPLVWPGLQPAMLTTLASRVEKGWWIDGAFRPYPGSGSGKDPSFQLPRIDQVTATVHATWFDTQGKPRSWTGTSLPLIGTMSQWSVLLDPGTMDLSPFGTDVAIDMAFQGPDAPHTPQSIKTSVRVWTEQ